MSLSGDFKGRDLFHGSLYDLAFDGPRFFGPVTPFGGLSFMIGWFTLAVVAAKLFRAEIDKINLFFKIQFPLSQT